MAIRAAPFLKPQRRLREAMSPACTSDSLAHDYWLLLFREGSKLPGFLMQVGIRSALPELAGHAPGRPSGWTAFQACPAPNRICLAIEVGHSEGTLGAINRMLAQQPWWRAPAGGGYSSHILELEFMANSPMAAG